jgi:hypothetical protein
MKITTMKVALALALVGAIPACVGGSPRRAVDRPLEAAREPVSRGGSNAKPSLDEKRLAQFGLEVYWDSFIRGEAIAKVQLEGNCLYAITESNRLYQVDLHSGKVNWVYDVGQPIQFTELERPIAEFAYPQGKENEGLDRYDEVYFIAKDTLYALDKKGGADLWRLPLPFGASSPPQPTTTHVLVGSWDDWIYAIKKSSNPVTYHWKWRTDGDIFARSAFESPFAFVPSTDGSLYTFDASRGEPAGPPFKTERALSADPLIYKKLIYLGGEDMNLYVLNVDGRLEYRYPAGAPIKKRPVAIGNDIYIVTERVPGDRAEDPQHGVTALLRKGRVHNKTAHDFRWTRLKAERVLARGRESVYLLEPEDKGPGRKIVKLDAKDGYFRDELRPDGVQYFVSNPFDPNQKPAGPDALMGGLVFLGYHNGWIVALKERSEF